MSSPWQIEKQLLSLAAAKVYTDGAGAAILASAIISTKRARELVGQLTAPFAVVSFQDAVTDFDQPERFSAAAFTVEIAVENATDCYGQGAAAGGSQENLGSSGGQGVDQVLGELRALLGPFTRSSHGFAGLARATDRTETIAGVLWAFRRIEIVVTSATASRVYPEATNVLGAAAGGGVANLSWTLPAARFDRLQVVVRRSAAAGSAPATVTDGTGVTVTGSAATAVAAQVTGLAPGTYAFSVFVQYDDLNTTPAAAQRNSSPASITLAVT